MSHEIWLPMSVWNRRSSPVGPQRDPTGPEPPTLPASLPVSRPKPLYPKITLNRLLFWDPPM